MQIKAILPKIKNFKVIMIIAVLLVQICTIGAVYKYHKHCQAVKRKEAIKEAVKNKSIDNLLVIK